MEISFKTNRLKKDLDSKNGVEKKYGSRARYIMRRMAVLHNANNLSDVPRLPPEKCHQLTNDRDEQFAVTIKDQWRIVFIPDHDPIPRKEDNEGIDLSNVTKIKIIWIGDYHE
jgi:plasmid maintenance system killer protein